MVAILIMLAKVATLGLFETKLFLNRGFDVIKSIHDVINKILLGDSNYVEDVNMRPKLGNSRVSMREVIATSIL